MVANLREDTPSNDARGAGNTSWRAPWADERGKNRTCSGGWRHQTIPPAVASVSPSPRALPPRGRVQIPSSPNVLLAKLFFSLLASDRARQVTRGGRSRTRRTALKLRDRLSNDVWRLHTENQIDATDKIQTRDARSRRARAWQNPAQRSFAHPTRLEVSCARARTLERLARSSSVTIGSSIPSEPSLTRAIDFSTCAARTRACSRVRTMTPRRGRRNLKTCCELGAKRTTRV